MIIQEKHKEKMSNESMITKSWLPSSQRHELKRQLPFEVDKCLSERKDVVDLYSKVMFF